jgi:hypothetical protein
LVERLIRLAKQLGGCPRNTLSDGGIVVSRPRDPRPAIELIWRTRRPIRSKSGDIVVGDRLSCLEPVPATPVATLSIGQVVGVLGRVAKGDPSVSHHSADTPGHWTHDRTLRSSGDEHPDIGTTARFAACQGEAAGISTK